ncbi:MAG: hypothetical protein K9G36_01885 [Crocinitomicaceae bacterium]|nr:hypothetical protein [Crocinitomicaceae bacterium]
MNHNNLANLILRKILVNGLSFVTAILLFSSTNQIFSQLLTEKTELKKQLSLLSHFPNNPCEIQNEVMLDCTNKIAHFIRFESCLEDKSKLKGIIYGVVVIDDTLYNISLEAANTFFFYKETFLKDYKKLDKTAKTILENTNLQLNLDYYDNIREETRKMEEKKRLEEEEKKRKEEEKKRKEEEKKRLEEERLAKIKADEIANSIRKAEQDSITTEELKLKTIKLVEQITKQDLSIEAKIKTGKDNGGILISQFSFSTSEYGVVDLTLGIQNIGKKRIKYATFKLQPKNSVDDPVEYEKSFKGIGFIEPGSEGGWNFESAWFSDVIETLILKNITLVYEDGSSKLITKIGEIRIDTDESLSETIADRQKKIQHQFGSVVLVEYPEATEPMVGFCTYSVDDKELKVTVLSKEDTKTLVSDLKEIIRNRQTNLAGIVGDFEVTKFSTLIYFNLLDGYTLMSQNEAELILKKLETIFIE